MRALDVEFDGWPSERVHELRSGGRRRLIDTTRTEGNKIVLGRYEIEYDAAGREVSRGEGYDTVTLYLH